MLVALKGSPAPLEPRTELELELEASCCIRSSRVPWGALNLVAKKSQFRLVSLTGDVLISGRGSRVRSFSFRIFTYNDVSKMEAHVKRVFSIQEERQAQYHTLRK